MGKIVLVAAFCVACVSTAAEAVCTDAESEFLEAVAAYKSTDGAAFMKRLVKNGPLANDQRALSQAQSLVQIEQFFGKFDGASVLSTKQVGSRTCYLVGVLEYVNGPAFAVATYYKNPKGAAVTSVFFQTEPEQILPKQFLVD